MIKLVDVVMWSKESYYYLVEDEILSKRLPFIHDKVIISTENLKRAFRDMVCRADGRLDWYDLNQKICIHLGSLA